MNKILLFVYAILLLGCSSTKTSLFNGDNLNGWEVYGTEKWYVENGNLISESGPSKEYGYLGTTKNYKNFILELEFKQEANGNSGVFFRSTIDGVKIDFADKWVHLRKSNTEPIIRIYTEAKSQDMADDLADSFITTIKNIASN